MINSIAFILAAIINSIAKCGEILYQLLLKGLRQIGNFWRIGLDTPFFVTYSLVLMLGVAVLGLHIGQLRHAIGYEEMQLALSLISVLLLIVLTFQARALKRVKGESSRIRRHHSQLRNAFSQLQNDDHDRHGKLEELSIIRELGLAINSILDFDRLLMTSSKIIADTVAADGYILFLCPEDSNSIRFQLGHRGKKSLTADGTTVKRLEQQYLDNNTAIITPKIIEDDHCGQTILVPLADSEKRLGLLCLFQPQSGQFSIDDVKLLSIVGKQLSIALKNAILYDLAIKDGLTGLYVHRHFQHRLQQEIASAQRYGRGLAIAMIDIDNFKRFNDTYGHQLGDDVLRAVSDIIRQSLRDTDSAYRYGGEEMTIILTETTAAEARVVTERIRQSIEAYQIDSGKGPVHVTASFGLAEWQSTLKDKSELIKHADDALYQAKDAGRNQVIVWAPPKQVATAKKALQPIGIATT